MASIDDLKSHQKVHLRDNLVLSVPEPIKNLRSLQKKYIHFWKFLVLNKKKNANIFNYLVDNTVIRKNKVNNYGLKGS